MVDIINYINHYEFIETINKTGKENTMIDTYEDVNDLPGDDADVIDMILGGV